MMKPLTIYCERQKVADTNPQRWRSWNDPESVYDEVTPLQWIRAMADWDQTKFQDPEVESFHEPMIRLFETISLLEQLSQKI